LRDKDVLVRISAAKALGGTLNESVIPALVEALEDDPSVAENAAQSLLLFSGVHAEKVALEVAKAINGGLGDKLANINSKNNTLVDLLHNVMLRCGKAMEHAQA